MGREGGDLKEELLQDPEIRRTLAAQEIEKVWGVKHHLTNIDFFLPPGFFIEGWGRRLKVLNMRVKIFVSLKSGVLDPQGKAIERSLHTLGYSEVQDVRMGKYLEFTVEAVSQEAAESRIREMCEKLLANPVIEDYRFEIEG